MGERKLTGRFVIETILENMRQQVEELRYSMIVPAAFEVYLHASDHQRLEGLGRVIVAEAVRALEEELGRLNRPSRIDRVRELVKKPRLPFQKVGPWLVRIERDHDSSVEPHHVLVVSQIVIGDSDALEGARTKRLATVRHDDVFESRVVPSAEGRSVTHGPALFRGEATGTIGRAGPAPPPAERPEGAPAPLDALRPTTGRYAPAESVSQAVLATLSWEDENGPHVNRMDRLEIVIGREAQDSRADVRLKTIPDVSRNHFRIRFDPQERRFWAEDTSLLGTTVNGNPIPRGVEQPLPSPADIRLADAVTIRFESEVVP